MMTAHEVHRTLPGSLRFLLASVHGASLPAMYLAATCLSTLFLLGSDVAAQDPLAGDVVISQLREALSRYDSLEFKASAQRRSSGSDGATNGETLVEQEQVVFRHVGARVLFSIKSKYVHPRKESPSFSQSDFVVSEDGDVLHINTRIDSSYDQVPGDTGNLGLILYSQRIAGTQTRDRDSVLRLPIEFATVTWFVGGLRLLEYLDHANGSSTTQHAEGALVDVQSPFGNVHLSLSKHYGWLPTKFEITKRPEHRTADGQGKTIADFYAEHSIEFESMVFAGEMKGFATDKNGLWFAKDILLTRLSRFRNRPEGRVEVETEVDELLFSPELNEEDFRSKLLVPEGSSVTVDGATHLPYRWDGEKAVPGVPELPASSKRHDLEDIAKRGGGVATRTLLIAFNITLAAIFVLSIYSKRRRA